MDFSIIKNADITTTRFLCLCAAMLVYALLGSPTPDAPGVAEAIIAVFLAGAAGLPGFYNALKPEDARPAWCRAARALLIYGLTMPLAAGVLRGAEAGHIFRDMFPFMFMTLPLFMHDIFRRRPEFLNYFTGMVIFSGLVFSARSLPESLGAVWPGTYEGELHYFSNAPSVLFATVFLCAFSAQNFVRRFSLKAGLFFVVCVFLSVLPLAVMAMTMQRASIGMFILCGGVMMLAGFYRYPQKTALMILMAGVLCVPAFYVLADVFEMLGRKTALVGFNMRAEEMAAAWRQISGEPGSLFFGTGWGGTFESPAVGGIRVNYTHSLLSAMLLKTGLLGMGLTLMYIAGVIYALMKTGFKNMPLLLAIGAPLMIDVVFYAAYKSLDFGFILLLAVLAAPAVQKFSPNIASRGGVLYSNL